MKKNKKTVASSISSLVLGIISVVSALFYYISLPTGILAIVMGSISVKKQQNKIGKTGLILGIIGTSLCVFIYISMVIILILANS